MRVLAVIRIRFKMRMRVKGRMKVRLRVRIRGRVWELEAVEDREERGQGEEYAGGKGKERNRKAEERVGREWGGGGQKGKRE